MSIRKENFQEYLRYTCVKYESIRKKEAEIERQIDEINPRKNCQQETEVENAFRLQRTTRSHSQLQAIKAD